MRFLDNKDYPEPDNDSYYDLPANPPKRKLKEFDERKEVRCPVKPVKWWNRNEKS